jgi:hypothetical protein
MIPSMEAFQVMASYYLLALILKQAISLTDVATSTEKRLSLTSERHVPPFYHI